MHAKFPVFPCIQYLHTGEEGEIQPINSNALQNIS